MHTVFHRLLFEGPPLRVFVGVVRRTCVSPELAALGRAPRPFFGELAGWRVAGAAGEKHEFSAVPVGPRADCSCGHSCGHGPLSGGTLSSATNVPVHLPNARDPGDPLCAKTSSSVAGGRSDVGRTHGSRLGSGSSLDTAPAGLEGRTRTSCGRHRSRKDRELAPPLSAQGVLSPVQKRLSLEEQTQR